MDHIIMSRDGKSAIPVLSHTLPFNLIEVAMDLVCRSRLRKDSAFFFRTRIQSRKFVKNRTGGQAKFLTYYCSSVIWLLRVNE